jgi:ankyrin repeat protein
MYAQVAMPRLSKKLADEILEAAEEGDLQDVTRLLTKDKRLLEARDDERCTPLLLAAYFGHDAILRLLLEKGTRRPLFL